MFRVELRTGRPSMLSGRTGWLHLTGGRRIPTLVRPGMGKSQSIVWILTGSQGSERRLSEGGSGAGRITIGIGTPLSEGPPPEERLCTEWGSGRGFLVVPSAHPQSLGSKDLCLNRGGFAGEHRPLLTATSPPLKGLGEHTPWAPILARCFPESTQWADSAASRGPM